MTDLTRKRLAYRAWHRGTREMDFLMGRFVDSVLPALSEAELAQLTEILEMSDPELYDLKLAGKAPDGASPLLRQFIAFAWKPGLGEGA
jgi:antitoxin CptB